MPGVLSTALAFARHGHAVFPVNWPVKRDGKLVCSCGTACGRNAAKHPFGKLAPRGLLSATTDPGIVKHWFGYAAAEANLAVVTDKLVILDVDTRHDGDESLAALEREHGELPHTWRVLTGGGGQHILFAAPDGVEIKSVVAELMESPPLGRGIDIRARGGYIIAPPSRHISGREYAWSVDHHPKETPLAPAPDWLLKRLANGADDDGGAHEPPPSDQWVKLTRQPVSEYREWAADEIAYHLFCHNCDRQLVLGLMHTWNSAWCKPPLGYHELEKIVRRKANKQAARIERELSP
jgi:hypothetical protein